jgi:hypothetical protein
MEAGVRSTTEDDTSAAVMPLLFAMLCFAIAAFSFFVAFVAAHIWLAATVILRLLEGKFLQAASWSCLLAFLISLW